jgi:hypothetical protein
MENAARSDVSAAFTQLAALRDFSITTCALSLLLEGSLPSESVAVSGEFLAVERASDTATAFFRDWCRFRKYSTDG